QGRAWRSWSNVFKQLTRIRPDAIILHSVKTILPCWLYARRRGIRLIAVEHQSNALKERSEWVVSRLLMILAAEVVVLTPDYQQELEYRLGTTFRTAKTHTIPNGIDVSLFSPRSEARLGRRGIVVIGMAARFSSKKRQGALVEALNILRSSHSQIDWRLSLAGDGETLGDIREQ
ncbi:MAG: glycosyltransferase family 4 protein, partial [Planctomycetes bacterium]|nr:glycosyltransferase family 4 protein [Planctomycetota bacterium]